jgi:acetyl-CoA carboxylase carboxyltransferase component
MGLEGAVRLGFAKELAAQPTPERQERLFNKLVSKAYQQGKALNMASFLEIDAVIDQQESRQWILRGLNASGFNTGRHGGRPFVDTF